MTMLSRMFCMYGFTCLITSAYTTYIQPIVASMYKVRCYHESESSFLLSLTLLPPHSLCFISNTVNGRIVSHFQNSIVVA
jgi:hypothetical protein